MPPAPRRILLIDDDRSLCALIATYLRPHGFEVTGCHQGDHGAARAVEENWDAVLLDVSLPGLGGYTVLRQIRTTSRVPVLMLTARNEEADRIAALDHGADDFIPKIFSQRELRARLDAVLRRAPAEPAAAPRPERAPILRSGPLHLDLGAHRATWEERTLELTGAEFALLACFMQSPAQVLSRADLVARARDRAFELFDRSVDVHIVSLRKKLGDSADAPRFIRTVRGTGYCWDAPVTTSTAEG